MSAFANALRFVLGHIEKHGDADAARTAARHLGALDFEMKELEGIAASLPGISDVPPINSGLGSTGSSSPDSPQFTTTTGDPSKA